MEVMQHLRDAIASLEKANADLEPELLPAEVARELFAAYTKVVRLGGFGMAGLTRKVADENEVARMAGTSVGQAKATVATGKALRESPELGDALAHGEVSLEQAAEIAKAEESSPGAAADLLQVARKGSFHVLKEKARKVKLEAEQHRGLADRQRKARSARSYSDDLGMVNVHLTLEPHVGTPIVARAEAEAQRRYRKAKKDETKEPFEAHLVDAYAAMLAGSKVKGPARRPELVVLVSHEIARRGWKDVRDAEVCKNEICSPPSPSPHPPQQHDWQVFRSGVFYDGKDLRHFKRWTKHIPKEIAVALELGDPPDFDGVRCVDCGNRFRTQFDHIEPRVARGPTSHKNLDPRCCPCHEDKTERDRREGKLRPGGT